MKEQQELEDDVYKYVTDTATYHIRFNKEPKMMHKCGILCAKDKLVEEVLNALDQVKEPETYDILDMKACVYDIADFGGTIYFLSSYTVEVELVSMNSAEQ
ncbi:hypothetical protein [Pontibacter actiniarum]|uniref:Uncharacterized protein n=1 Tax=Pontibacter actiniarum TaxID=323450 RepID=A0A1X9YSH9_9BACT|nr:hypothetical protein [Pontibacter actiniarum]ARS35817.1 hypothetical protein CA264_10385 [Pontibacter actiniarum]